jgi:hypothetical protein
MRWTKEKPTETGWYWVRWKGIKDPPGIIAIQVLEDNPLGSSFCFPKDSLWFGPIKPPKF